MDGRVPIHTGPGARGHDRTVQGASPARRGSRAGDRDGFLRVADGEDNALPLQPGEKGLDSIVMGTGDSGLGTGVYQRTAEDRNRGNERARSSPQSPVPNPQSP